MHSYLKNTLSEQRVKTYEDLARAPGETRTAEQLYRLNLLYSKELYVVLGALEIIVRNSFHSAISRYYNKEDWFSLDLLLPKHKAQIDKAVEHLVREKKGHYVIGDIIAQLNFGFWVHLCDRPYEKKLWNRTLFSCFPYLGGRPDRINIERRLNACLRLRNKVAHLEPIIKYESTLIQEYRNIIQLMYAICPETQKWFESLCQFEDIWNNRNGNQTK